MPYADVNGQRLFYEDTGGPGLPVVFSHGLLMDHRMFVPQVEALARECRVITWDERCHGETQESAEPFTYWDSAEDLAGLLHHLGVERAVLAGTSQGGFLSLRFALRHPERVIGLVLIDTQAGPEEPDKLATYEVMRAVWNEDGLTEQLGEMVAAVIVGSERPESAEWIARWRTLSPARRDQAWAALTGREDVHDRLPEIEAPALVIHGEQDVAIDMELAERLCAGLPDCRGVIRIPDAGHSSNLTHPEPVNRAIQRFLATLVQSR
jgi:pimeloyl-ACP methyl ester carboxylesterase